MGLQFQRVVLSGRGRPICEFASDSSVGSNAVVLSRNILPPLVTPHFRSKIKLQSTLGKCSKIKGDGEFKRSIIVSEGRYSADCCSLENAHSPRGRCSKAPGKIDTAR